MDSTNSNLPIATETRDKNLLTIINKLNLFFKTDTVYQIKFFNDSASVAARHRGIIYIGYLRYNDSSGSYVYLQKIKYSDQDGQSTKNYSQEGENFQKKKFIQIHGNILYALNYRSYIDTPFDVQDMYQHMLQSYLDVTIKDQYPVRVYINSNFSNAPLLRNFTNLDFQYNRSQFINAVKSRLENWAASELLKQTSLDKLKDSLDQQQSELRKISAWLHSNTNYQKLVEERERDFLKNYSKTDVSRNKNITSNTDSLKNNQQVSSTIAGTVLNSLFSKNKIDSNDTEKKFGDAFANGQNLYDSLSKQYARLKLLYESKRAMFGNDKDSLIRSIQNIKSIDELREAIKDKNLPDSILPKGYKKLLAVRSIGLGTMPVNYSELTIRNVNITGAEIEYNPSYYLAFASGSISYTFRNYFLGNRDQPKQYVTAVRFGKGQLDGNHVIATVYTGKKFTYPGTVVTNDSVVVQPRIQLIGIALESRYQIDRSNFILAEFAKSSLPYYYSSIAEKKTDLASVFRFREHSNEAYSIKLQSLINLTQTKISANYKKLGINFQSYGLFTNNTSQNSWYIKIDQPLFKRQLLLNASLRQNDFSNPYTEQQYSSKVIFKSLQATFRRTNWPIISLGYFPSSQIIKLGSDAFIENVFYTLTGTVNSSYKIKNAVLNSALMYTQFYNKASDSDFVFFNTRNIMLNQNIFLQKFNLNGNTSIAFGKYYNLYTLGAGFDCKIKNWLIIGGGLKFNHQTVFENNLPGFSIRSKVKIPLFGTIEIDYDKDFIPGANRSLVPNTTSRVSYLKTF